MTRPSPLQFMIERRYGSSNCDWLHKESQDIPVWTLCARHAFIFESLDEAAKKLAQTQACALGWPNGAFFRFAIIGDRRQRPYYFASKPAVPITGV